ncbi:cardiolipin synthase [Peptostreptococcus russellii]|uniref:Cardiolipin synthase n=1 Tax=Peptostreptococcus russellii TaxID=215200 RepID=A0A1H8HC79_9FIRM|nr:cardiolipin synthase [Peptostreptococcus russellii]SEN53579.1 cardiolipin synthase [Peptostreptococcus russellii]
MSQNLIFWMIAIITLLSYLIGIIITMNILLENRDPAKTLSWMMMFLLFPGVGIIIYIFSGRNIRKHKLFKAKKKTKNLSEKKLSKHLEYLKNIVKTQQMLLERKELLGEDEGAIEERVINLLLRIGSFPYTTNNDVEIYKNGPEKFSRLIEDMENAKDHIHLEYFIIKDSCIAREIQELLIRKAKEGVDVKILYDDVACWRFKIHRDFLNELKAAGVKCAAFLPTKLPLLGGQLNYRNHRKIAVIDGKIGYTGGLNIGDEYMGLNKKFGYWRDSHIRIYGAGVHMLQMIFLIDWYLTTNEIISDKEYMPDLPHCGEVALQVVGTGPDSQWEDIHYAFFSAISQAKKRVYIETPYFIPDESILKAIKTAALSGVDVRIVFPQKIDHFIVNIASYSYFDEVLDAGARVFLYQKGFIHSKVVIVDDEMASIGSSNMDLRSFMLNFEVNTFIYEKKTIEIIADQFYKDQEDSKELLRENFRTRNVVVRLAESISRLFSPLL